MEPQAAQLRGGIPRGRVSARSRFLNSRLTLFRSVWGGADEGSPEYGRARLRGPLRITTNNTSDTLTLTTAISQLTTSNIIRYHYHKLNSSTTRFE